MTTVRVTGTDCEKIVQAATEFLDAPGKDAGNGKKLFGDGDAARKIADIVLATGTAL